MTAPLHLPKACASCRAPIFWAQLPSGKSMPVDAAPTPDGTVLLFHTAKGSLRAHVLKKGEAYHLGAPRRTSHFVTCPQAQKHRRSR